MCACVFVCVCGGVSVLVSKPSTAEGVRGRDRHVHSLPRGTRCTTAYGKERQIRFRGGGGDRERGKWGDRERGKRVCVCECVCVCV